MKKIIVFLLFFPTLVFALDYDKKNDKENNPNNAASKIGALSGSGSGQKYRLKSGRMQTFWTC